MVDVAADGLLSKVGEQATDAHPRDFLIDKSGRWLLVASRDGNSVKVYRVNTRTGLLADGGQSVSLPKPVMLLAY